MNAPTRFLLLLAASAPLASCVAPPPPMPPDPEHSASATHAPAPRSPAPRGTAAHAAAPRPAGPGLAAARQPSRLGMGDHVGVTAHLGRRSIDDLDPADKHTPFGLEIDAYDEFAFVGFEGGFLYSKDRHRDGPVKDEASVFELYAGVRKTFTAADGRLHPYLSAGLTFLDVNMRSRGGGALEGFDDTETFGLYLRAGAYYRPTDMLRLGLDYRKVLGTHLSGTGGLDADYDQITLGVGVSL